MNVARTIRWLLLAALAEAGVAAVAQDASSNAPTITRLTRAEVEQILPEASTYRRFRNGLTIEAIHHADGTLVGRNTSGRGASTNVWGTWTTDPDGYHCVKYLGGTPAGKTFCQYWFRTAEGYAIADNREATPAELVKVRVAPDEYTRRYDGKWHLDAEKEGNNFVEGYWAYQADVELKNGEGTWKSLYVAVFWDPCRGKLSPIRHFFANEQGATFVIGGSETLQGCTDSRVVLKKVDDDTWEGKLSGWILLKAKRQK